MELSVYNPELAEALLHAYWNQAEMSKLVLYGLHQKFNLIVQPGKLPDQVIELLEWAEGEGVIDRLFAAALQRRPNNPKLKEVARKMGEGVLAEHSKIVNAVQANWTNGAVNPNANAVRQLLAGSKPSGGAFESLVVYAAQAREGLSFDEWVTAMGGARKRVCLIAKGSDQIGTGFLVGPDRIMTNAHVVPEAGGQGYRALFLDDGAKLTNPTAGYPLTSELARSDPHARDYAIFSLDRVPDGDRGFCCVRDHEFDTVRLPVSVLGYRDAQKLSFTFGVVFDYNSFTGHVAYSAGTEPGQSGSPVFTDAWGLVAIHHHGQANVNNHGIPMKMILQDLAAKNLSNLLQVC